MKQVPMKLPRLGGQQGYLLSLLHPAGSVAGAADSSPGGLWPHSAAIAGNGGHSRLLASATWWCECCGQHSKSYLVSPDDAPSYRRVIMLIKDRRG